MRRSALLTAGAFIGLASIVAAGTAASASARTTVAPKVVAASSFTLNLLGTPITVDVTTNVAGNLVDATVAGTAWTPTSARPNKVTFDTTPAGTSVSVKANHGGQSVTAHAATLADLGTGGNWTGDVFNTGVSTTVNFTLALRADRISPDITGVAVLPDCTVTSALPAVQNCVISPTTYGDDEDDNEGTEAMASVKFSLNGQTRTLRIRVGLHTEDGKTEAVVRMSLSKIKGAMTLADGRGVWTGMLCDGKTVASFPYLVAGTVVTVTGPTTPAGAEVKTNGNGVEVRFDNGPRVRIGSMGEDGNTTIGLKVKAECPSVIPTVGGKPVDPNIVQQGGNGGHGDHGGQGGDSGGGDNKNGND